MHNISIKSNTETFTESVHSAICEIVSRYCETGSQEHLLKYINNPGKKIRSQVVYSLGRALFVDMELLKPWAVANELLHEATLIHDDIQDEDEFRRNQPSYWKSYGAAEAINAGDFLLMASLKPLISLKNFELIELHNETCMLLAQGQAQDISFKDNKNSKHLEIDYSNCIQLKTASLFSKLASGVGHLALLKKEDRWMLEDLFSHIGCLYQMQDDLLDLFGDKKRDLIGCDLVEGKNSFILTRHLAKYPEDLSLINDLKAMKSNDDLQVQLNKIIDLILKKGTLEICIKDLKKEMNVCRKKAQESQALGENSHEMIDTILAMIMKPIKHLF